GATARPAHLTLAAGGANPASRHGLRTSEEKRRPSSGIPLHTNREWLKTATRDNRIDEMNKRLKAVEKKQEQKEQS
ncbi:UDP-3-O-(3-hydroxymyristoyl)glucosamine N-acyltransferase, partial [Vibrio parahaemolyticus]|nr:UDP-3-O-(3-hydroxymyristoyl)glucosamine N-acyltransferase [Vibrio parahaemolyticus]